MEEVLIEIESKCMNGVILVNKDANKTSRDMINELNHIFGIKKIGHTGTLDPIATGVLVVAIGRYTKLINELSSFNKEYIAKIKVGIKTDTLDITGNILEQRQCEINIDKLISIIDSMKGIFEQEIPIYSAKKINGKKLYEYARNNEVIQLPKNKIYINDIKLIDVIGDEITLLFNVSKGTYIRSLIEYICNNLNIIGTMSYLCRIKQGKFSINDSFTIKQIKNNHYNILKMKDLFDYPIINLTDDEFLKVKNGSKISVLSNSDKIILIYNNEEIALYKKFIDNIYEVDVMLYVSN